MKLAYLLAQFLYTNKRLDLPGIGTFTLDPSVIIESENSKQRGALPDGISFNNNPCVPETPGLIGFISEKAGKMKPLAIADFESHLQLAHQFLNIGKPFLFEGIGTIAQVRAGEFEFIPGTIITEKIKDAVEEVHGSTKKDSVDAKYKAYLSTPARSTWWKKPVIALLVVSGVALAVWGGYTISTRNAGSETATTSIADQQLSVPYDSIEAARKDSALQSAVAKANPESYKYVLEVAKGNRAFRRFNQLKENQWKVQLETNDSVQYKLFMVLPVTTDTTRVLDSLTAMTGRKVYIEVTN